ncbi:MAG: P-loop NTPase fold protein [Bacteroidales bacterium]|nr:P-loop NTPase fold protein [Bacteroidales bacterium]
MTERELKDKVLLAVYNRQDRLNVDFETFCKEEGIEFKSEIQQERVLQSLKDDGYIKALIFLGGQGTITSITSSGVEYAEELIAESFKKTDRSRKEGKIELDVEEPIIQNNVENNKVKIATGSISVFKAHENFEKIKDESVPPCFGVEELAECFVKHLDTTSETDSKNVCMVGIFAPWGRGKSYFFKKIKEIITNRNTLNPSTDIHYDVVEFNAWKYQETPAIWAYLFETIYKHKNRWFRFWYTIKRNWPSMLRDLVLFSLPLFVTWLLKQDCNWKIGALSYGLVGFVVNLFLKNYNSAISFIRRFSKGISFSNQMGIQSEIEKELTSLLKCWICKKHTDKRKIILYVDDIDRCSETKMVSIIDSLRTVLENEDIRKRLIVICSVDHNKLMSGVEHKYKELFSKDEEKEELKKIAIEQLDKIFLTGLSLSRLNTEEQLEFLAKIVDIKSTSDKNEQQVSYNSKSRENSSSNAVEIEAKIPDETLKNEMYKMLSGYIKNSKSELTPRKIRVIYYRMLLANNIISSRGKGSIFSDDIFKAIFDLSCGNECKLNSDNAFFNVVEMVVPY